MSKREVSLYSSVGRINEEIGQVKNTDELKKRLAELKIDTKNMIVSELNSDIDLNLDISQDLPEGDLQLYILPAKTKSGYLKVA